MPNPRFANPCRPGRFSAHRQLGEPALASRVARADARVFRARGFLEVETPLLSADVVVDRHLDPLSVVLPDDPRRPESGRRLWLQTSPEFGMKRLMAAGGEAIYQITRAFRAGEAGRAAQSRIHDRRVVSPRRLDGRRDATAFRFGRSAVGAGSGRAIQLCRGLRNARRHRSASRHARPSSPSLPEAAGSRSPKASADADRDGWLNLLLSHLVEPHLGQTRPTILFDYPASQAALAQVHGEPPRGRAVRAVRARNRTGQRLSRAARSAECCASGTVRPTATASPRASRVCPRKAGCWPPWSTACPTAPAWRWVSIAS